MPDYSRQSEIINDCTNDRQLHVLLSNAVSPSADERLPVASSLEPSFLWQHAQGAQRLGSIERRPGSYPAAGRRSLEAATGCPACANAGCLLIVRTTLTLFSRRGSFHHGPRRPKNFACGPGQRRRHSQADSSCTNGFPWPQSFSSTKGPTTILSKRSILSWTRRCQFLRMSSNDTCAQE